MNTHDFPFPSQPIIIDTMNSFIICGLKHSGKTSMGKALAKHFEIPCYDLDDLVLETANDPWNSVREIWQQLGKEAFMKLEILSVKRYVNEILPEHDSAILSLGGGTIENSDAVKHLTNTGKIIYLCADADMLFERIINKSGIPPFLSKEHPRKDFQDLYNRRNTLYTHYADIVHNVDDSPKEVNAQRLISILEADNVR